MRKVVHLALRCFEILLFPITIIAAGWSKLVTLAGIHRMGLSKRIYLSFGVLPVRDHYYQPLINPKRHLRYPLSRERPLPGINFDEERQLELLSRFNFNDELSAIPFEYDPSAPFHYNNGSYISGDAEYLYNIVRHFKPARIIEIGSGTSTKIALEALRRNEAEGKPGHLTCVEPYEQPWLEQTKAKIIRKRVEELDKTLFQELKANDILFIDSSHIIRPQGDVLFEFLELLPIINAGVLVHVHDIFTPYDYPAEWIITEHRMWNEQYLLEAFLTHNDKFEIIGALNFLSHRYKEQLAAKCPSFAKVGGEPGGFWMRKV